MASAKQRRGNSRPTDKGDMGKPQGEGSKRHRLRNWVFTIHTGTDFNTGEADPGTGGDRFWDPYTVSWDMETVRYITAGLEECPESHRLHWQGYIEFNRPVDLGAVKKHLGANWAHLEPRRGTQEQAIAYCKKKDTGVLDDDGDKILFEDGQPGQNGVRGRGSKNQNYREVLEAPTFEDALKMLSEKEPADYVRFHDSVKRGLMAHFLKLEVNIRPMSSFKRSPIDKDIFSKQAVVITGKSGAGKTAWSLAHWTKPFLVSHIDQLKEFNPLVYDAIVFDDMSFNHWPVSSCIHLVDVEMPRFINCRHTMGYLPKGMPRMFTSNLAYRELFNFGNAEQERAIDRRVHHVLINENLY